MEPYNIIFMLIIALALLAFYVKKSIKLSKLVDVAVTEIKEKENMIKEITVELVRYKNDFAEATKTHNEYINRFEKITNIEDEIKKVLKMKEDEEKSVEEIRKAYKAKREVFDSLVREAAIYDETIELSELGFYKHHYDFETTEDYKNELEKVKTQQKEMVSLKTAINCTTTWEINGNKTKGKAFSNKGIRLTGRAFNNECDAAISSARWNNATRIEERIVKAFESINKLNEENSIVISRAYLELKLKEFRLAYELQDKRQKIKEEQFAIRQQMREEAKLQEESEAAFREEERYKKMLEKAMIEVETATGKKLSELQQSIATLTTDLSIAHEKSERALSMAQQTKAGHVYIISNAGSFGENVYKIGMTRRLEPIDRVKELGNASVPFTFDLHAMIYSSDAPALENKLHKIFDAHRINLVNNRKEFFRTSLESIEKAVKENCENVEFYSVSEARDYRESVAILAQRSEQQAMNDARTEFPIEI
ncbi:DUF4041 domain-containing protein [Undibacterium sp. SXout7W]|uniref:DUF4041 domain-containing protein n=1 Tax=Undibacterium sp. SXout7W TaxID=3413049 RepID=UPI003BF3AEE2